MADFDISYKRVMGNEGHYSNDPIDKGGETYRGISRVNHPYWEGWKIIDEYKDRRSFPDNMKDDIYLEKLAYEFYYKTYWNKFWGDYIECQEIADELYDISINMGVERAVIFLQRSLNLLNRNQKDYSNIQEDGIFGRMTLSTLNSHLPSVDFFTLYKMLNIMQGCFYINIMERDESQERFLRGWLKRVNITKNDK
jgi:lysozyme family protein